MIMKSTEMTASPAPSALELFISAMDALEAAAVPLDLPARRAFTAMIDTVDVAFQTARAIAGGVDPNSPDIRQPFLFTAMKMFEVNRRLGQLDSSHATRCLGLMGAGEHRSPFSED
jgi:hypothetical protein